MTDADMLRKYAQFLEGFGTDDHRADNLRTIADNLEALQAENLRLKEQSGRQVAEHYD